MKTTFAITTTETIHGNPGERRSLPEGLRIRIEPADNLGEDSKIKWWAKPAKGHPWPKNTAEWAKDVGVGLHAEDVKVLTADDVKSLAAADKADKMAKAVELVRGALEGYSEDCIGSDKAEQRKLDRAWHLIAAKLAV